jgi:hypothetical protein
MLCGLASSDLSGDIVMMTAEAELVIAGQWKLVPANKKVLQSSC